MSNVFSNPNNPSIPTKGMSTRTDAVRVAAHKEGQKNSLDPINNSMKTGPMGKLGIRGDAQQK